MEDTSQKQLNLLIKKSTMWAFLSLLLYKIILDFSYYFVISKIWAYSKLGLNFNNIKLIESYVLFFIIFSLIPKSSKKLSSILVWLLILLSYIPMLTIFAFKNESRIFMYAATAFWMFILLLLHMPNIHLSSLKQAGIVRISLFVLFGVVVFSMIYRYLGLSFNLNLTKVYEIRARYTEMGIPLVGYLFNWQAHIVNCVFFALFVVRKKWLYMIAIVVLQLLLFSNTGLKTFLFALPFVLILMWVVTRKNPFAYMAFGLVGVILLGMLSYWLIDDVWVSSLFTRRTLLIPAQLSFFYYDFFSTHEHVFLSHSILRFFLDYPYDLNPPHLIGAVYFNHPEMGANTGIIGDAYMNYGFVGLALWGILLAIILKLIDTCSKGRNIKIAVAAIAMPAITLTNSALLTNILTHGLFLSLIFLYLLPKGDVK